MSEKLSTFQSDIKKSNKRYIFIDLYRSAVILLMLEGHVFRTFLPSKVQQSPWFQIHEFFHGLSAPAFLFGAGLTFVISTRRRWEEYHHWDPPLAKRVRRLLLVIFLGLALHFPYFSLRKILVEGTFSEYLSLFQFDVLHCIGIGLLSLHGLIFFFKDETKFYSLVIASIFIIGFITPIIWGIDFLKILSLPLAQMFNGYHGSPFPIFPYVGFLYAGVIVSWEFIVATECRREKKFMTWLAITGMVFIIIGYIFDVIPWQVYPVYNYWFTSPNYFLVRTGSLMVIISTFWYVSKSISEPKKIFTVLGIESLFVYVLHLLILYGSVINPSKNLQLIFGNHLTLFQTTEVFAGLLIISLGASLLWNYLKEKHYIVYLILQITGAGIFLLLFFTRRF